MIRLLICGSKSNWVVNLNLIYETLWTGKKLLVDFNAGKTRLVLFDLSNNNGLIDLERDGSVLEEKSSFKMLGLTYSWIGALLLSLLLKLAPRKLEPGFIL